MDELTSRIISLVPDRVRPEKGVALYSGREAWDPDTSNGFYIMGMNPGGDEESHDDVPVETQIAQQLSEGPYSAYTVDDEPWSMGKGRGTYPRGQAPFQLSIQHLAEAMNIDLQRTPSTNSVFVRSRTWAELGTSELATPNERREACWPFHAEMMEFLNTQVLVLIGSPGFVLTKLGIDGRHRIDHFAGTRKSNAYIVPSGMVVLHLGHPSYGQYWYDAKYDPTPMVKRALRQNGIFNPA